MKKYLLLIFCLFIASINFNLFLNPTKLVTGGTQGLAIVIEHFINISPSLIVLIINITSLIISYIFQRKETTTSVIISTFIYPLFIKLTSVIPTPPIIRENLILTSLIAGIICGITNGIIYKLNYSTGGITIINLLLNTYFNIKISLSTFTINTIIIMVGLIIYSLKKVLYSLIVVTISSIIIHLIMKKKLTKNKT